MPLREPISSGAGLPGRGLQQGNWTFGVPFRDTATGIAYCLPAVAQAACNARPTAAGDVTISD
jgi:hypothetical protein